MIEVRYFVDGNKSKVESLLCDWLTEEIENDKAVLICWRNGISESVGVIATEHMVLIQSVFEGSEE